MHASPKRKADSCHNAWLSTSWRDVISRSPRGIPCFDGTVLRHRDRLRRSTLREEYDMFSVIFETFPNKAHRDDYFDNAKMLHPELEQVEGFVDNIRYKSMIR